MPPWDCLAALALGFLRFQPWQEAGAEPGCSALYNVDAGNEVRSFVNQDQYAFDIFWFSPMFEKDWLAHAGYEAVWNLGLITQHRWHFVISAILKAHLAGCQAVGLITSNHVFGCFGLYCHYVLVYDITIHYDHYAPQNASHSFWAMKNAHLMSVSFNLIAAWYFSYGPMVHDVLYTPMRHADHVHN